MNRFKIRTLLQLAARNSRPKNLCESLEPRVFLSTVTWKSTVASGNWGDSANWTGAGGTGLPGAGDTVVLSTAATITMNVTPPTLAELDVTKSVVLDLDGNNLAITDEFATAINVSSAPADGAKLDIIDNVISANNTISTLGLNIATGAGEKGEVDVEGGNVTFNIFNQNINIGTGALAGATFAEGTLNDSGATIAAPLSTLTLGGAGIGHLIVDDGIAAFSLSNVQGPSTATPTSIHVTNGGHLTDYDGIKVPVASTSSALDILIQTDSVLTANNLTLVGNYPVSFQILDDSSWTGGSTLAMDGASSGATASLLEVDDSTLGVSDIGLQGTHGTINFSASDSIISSDSMEVGDGSNAVTTFSNSTVGVHNSADFNGTGSASYSNLTIEDGSSVNIGHDDAGGIPYHVNHIGTLTMDAATYGTLSISGSTLTTRGFDLGSDASGFLLNMQSGAVIYSTNVNVASGPSSGTAGTVTLDGTGTQWINHMTDPNDPNPATFDLSAGANVNYTVQNHALIETDTATFADVPDWSHPSVTITLDGTQFEVLDQSTLTLGTAHTDPAKIVLDLKNGGTLTMPTGSSLLKYKAKPEGTGTIIVDITTTGPSTDFSPGDSATPFGTLTIDGNLDASAGFTLDSVLGSSNTSNLLAVTGTVTLGGDFAGQFAAITDGVDSTTFTTSNSFTILTAAAIIGLDEDSDPIVGGFGDYSFGDPIVGDRYLPVLADNYYWTLKEVTDGSNTDLQLAVGSLTLSATANTWHSIVLATNAPTWFPTHLSIESGDDTSFKDVSPGYATTISSWTAPSNLYSGQTNSYRVTADIDGQTFWATASATTLTNTLRPSQPTSFAATVDGSDATAIDFTAANNTDSGYDQIQMASAAAPTDWFDLDGPTLTTTATVESGARIFPDMLFRTCRITNIDGTHSDASPWSSTYDLNAGSMSTISTPTLTSMIAIPGGYRLTINGVPELSGGGPGSGVYIEDLSDGFSYKFPRKSEPHLLRLAA